MVISRRNLLKGTAYGAGLLAAGSVGSYFLKKHLSQNYLNGQLGGFPLLYSAGSEGFKVSISLSAVGGKFASEKVSENLKNFFYVLFYDPEGHLKYKKEFVLDSFQHQTVELENLGWGSAIIAYSLPQDTEQLPQIDSISSFSHLTSFGEDGHHVQSIRTTKQNSFHTIFAPAVNEERLVSFFNPFPIEITGNIELFNRAGQLIKTVPNKWKPFQTKYIAVGDGKINPLNTTRVVDIKEGEPLVLRTSGNRMGGLISSSWHLKSSGTPFFAQSHGANFREAQAPDGNISEEILLSTFSKAKSLHEVSGFNEVFPGDYTSLPKKRKATKIYIPNTTDTNLNTGVFLSNDSGELIGNSFRSFGPVNVPPFGVAEFDVQKILENQSLDSVGVFSCYVGHRVTSSYSLTKAVSRDSVGRVVYQHLRPREAKVSKQEFPDYFDGTGGFITDYWISNINFK
ncbi:MAG TPA: hypothetical protein VGE46_02710, partial [Bdellovibrio sp.]